MLVITLITYKMFKLSSPDNHALLYEFSLKTVIVMYLLFTNKDND